MKVCIEQMEDGTYSVTMGDQMGQEVGQGMGQDQGQTFQSLEEAIEAVRSTFGGEEQAKPMIEGEEDFVAGFKEARGGEGMGF